MQWLSILPFFFWRNFLNHFVKVLLLVTLGCVCLGSFSFELNPKITLKNLGNPIIQLKPKLSKSLRSSRVTPFETEDSWLELIGGLVRSHWPLLDASRCHSSAFGHCPWKCEILLQLSYPVNAHLRETWLKH